MENYNKILVDSLAEKSKDLYLAIDNADKWVDGHLKFEEKKSVAEKIKQARCDVRKIKESVDSKPVFALFGGSQVGKSYLVKNLLSIKGAPLMIQNESTAHDFLKEINPQGGGAEATGLVTRFTADQPEIPGYSVRLKLLSVKDIVIVFCDSFFSDIVRMESYPNREEFKANIDELENLCNGKGAAQGYLTEDDIWDIKNYFFQNFNKFSYYVGEIENSGYWNMLGKIAENLPVNLWQKAFSILWGRNETISQVFSMLVAELQKIGFEKIVHVPFEGVLREGKRLLDVRQLSGIIDDTDQLNVRKSDGTTVKLSVSKLSALTAEVTLSVPVAVTEEKEFFKNTDLLDFPGARGRLQLLFQNINEKSVVQMYLRGKISYLFNKYSSDYEINNLLFCLKDEQIEVNEIPLLLNDWITKNIGEDANARNNRIKNMATSPLFVVFTFFNRQLAYDSTNDEKEDVSYKWENRFNTFFKKQIVTTKFDWDVNWTSSDGDFKNFYLLRDFKYSGDTFSGFEKEETETGVAPLRQRHLENLKKSFVSFPFVKAHFNEPATVWQEVAVPNKDGSELILQSLAPAANNLTKIRNYAGRLDEYKTALKIVLKKQVFNDDIKERRDAAFQLGNDILGGLTMLFRDPVSFSLLQTKMMIKETDAYNFIHENLLKAAFGGANDEEFNRYAVFRSLYPTLSARHSKEENLEILRRKLSKNSIEGVLEWLNENKIDLDSALENRVRTSATRLVDGLIEQWKIKLGEANFTDLFNKGLKHDTHTKLITNLIITFDSLQLREQLIRIFEQKTRMVSLARDTEEYLAAYFTGNINDFVCTFGFNFMQDARKSELIAIGEQYDEGISKKLVEEQMPVSNADLKVIYDSPSQTQPLHENFMLYLVKMRLALLSNCGFKNYDINANDQLKKIIDSIEKLDFTLN